MTLVLVAFGAAVGSAMRFLAGRLWDRPELPWGTLMVNVLGSFILGLVAFNLDRLALAGVGTGFCGGLTTYSAFAVQAVGRDRRINWTYLGLTLLLCLLGSAVGVAIGQQFIS